MNAKRWLAVAIALVILAISYAVPKYQPTMDEATTKQLDELYGSILGDDSIIETVLEDGDSDSRILQLELNGTIASGGGSMLGTTGYNHAFFLMQLDKVLEDESIKGILFLVNTPGGGVYESAEIRERILKIKEHRQIPIYVSMQAMAASGGYYVSADATKIYASENTWTGSIGVIIQALNYSELMEKNGVKAMTYTSGDLKAMGSPYHAPTEKADKVLQGLVDESYERFVDIIVNGRGMDEATVKKLADGRIYTGTQAAEHGLVDEIGYSSDTLAALRADYNLTESQLIKYEVNPSSQFLDLFSQMDSMLDRTSEIGQLRQLFESRFDGAPRPYYIYGGQ